MKKIQKTTNDIEKPSKKLKTSSGPDLTTDTQPNDLQEIRLNFDMHRLRSEFFDAECLILAKKLLNKYLIRRIQITPGNYSLAVGKIVETEAYLGGTDKASHTFNNKQTDRLKAMYMTPGTAYVYNIYGMYCCLNISAREPGAGVLIRALEPCYGVQIMRRHRNLAADKKIKELTNGPSKLCMAMSITKIGFNEVDLASSEDMWLQDELSEGLKGIREDDLNKELGIVAAKRIGIDYAGEEAVNQLYRFYVRGNKFVSVKDKVEIILNE